MLRSVLPSLCLLTAAIAQQAAPTPNAAATTAAPKTFANATCPIMGKKVSLPLFVDTELGRIYLCCKPCIKKVLNNVAAAHKTAYPVITAVDNARCPVSGEPIGAHKVSVTLQGFRFQVCCEQCVDSARTHSQLVLQKLDRPDLIDVGNDKCPLQNEAVAAQAFAVIDGHIVHLSSPRLIDSVNKDPAGTLQKAKDIAKAQPAKPKHVPQPKTAPTTTPPAPKAAGAETAESGK